MRLRALLDKKILLKALAYRGFVFIFDVVVVVPVFVVSGNMILSLLLLNILKVTGYYVFEVFWSKKEIRTRFNLFGRLKKILNLDEGDDEWLSRQREAGGD